MLLAIRNKNLSCIAHSQTEGDKLKSQTLSLLLGAAFAAATGQIFFRIGARDRADISTFINFYVMAGLFFYGLGTIVWIYALSKEQITTVYAFTGLTFVLVYLGGVILLGEHINQYKSIGVLLVLAGLYIIVRN